MKRLIIQILLLLIVFDGFSQNTDAILLEDTTYYYSDKDFELIVAASTGDTNKLVAFLEIGANVNSTTYEGVTPLMFAAQNGHLRTVEILIDSGATVNLKPYNMMDALLGACFAGHIEVADTLILNGADINSQNFNGVTPLMYAVAYDNLMLTDMLLFYKADVKKSDYEGNSALHLSTFFNNIEISSLLLENQSPVDKVDNDGFTPLMVAAQNGSIEHIELLLAKGVDLGKTNNNNLDALSLAIVAKQNHVVEYLISKGANYHHIISPRMNQYDLADLYGSRQAHEMLKEAGGKPQLKSWVNKMYLNPVLQFNNRDILMGFHAGVIDSKTGFQAEFGYKTRPWVRSILYEISENTYYQFWEKRSLIHLGLDKNFRIKNISHYEKLGLFGGANFAYTYGNFRGSEKKPDDEFKIVPKLGLFYQYKLFNLRVNYEYIKFKNNDSPPHRVSISVGLLLNIMKNKISLKHEPNL